ncbi:MAG: hypothetical protein ACRDBM_07235, partial [Sporomusa sp.]
NTRGTITFAKDTIVGAFRNEHSERIHEYPRTKAIDYFKDATQEIRNIAVAESLEYLYDEIDNIAMPVATTAFWSEGGKLFSCDSDEEFYEQGGAFIKRLVLPGEQLYDEIRDEYEFDKANLQGLKFLVEQKNGSLFNSFSISTQQLEQIIGENPEGAKECLEAFTEINISITR